MSPSGNPVFSTCGPDSSTPTWILKCGNKKILDTENYVGVIIGTVFQHIRNKKGKILLLTDKNKLSEEYWKAYFICNGRRGKSPSEKKNY